MTVGEAIAFVGSVLAIAAVVSFAVAGIIRLLTALAGRAAASAAAPPVAKPVLETGPTDEERAAIFAAVAAVCGPHRIVHIADTATGHAWVAEGRARQHGSHLPPHRPRR